MIARLSLLLATANGFANMPTPAKPTDPPAPMMPECMDGDMLPFPVPDVAEKNKVFDQLTVAEQLTVEGMMAKHGVSFEGWNKCKVTNCSTIGKLQLVKPPKSQVLAYFAGGPKPKRIAQFWWLRANLAPKVAQLMQVEMPITQFSEPTMVKEVPWGQRPFIYWEQYFRVKRNDMLDPLKPIFDPILAQIKPSPSLLALLGEDEEFEPSVGWSGGATVVQGSTENFRMYYGRMSIKTKGSGYFKDGPMTFTLGYDFTTDETTIFDISICPGTSNPVFPNVDAVLAAHSAGTLQLCDIDGEYYGDTMAHLTPEPPYYIDPAVAKRAGAVLHSPEGKRFQVSGRTVAWMGWDFHADINGITGVHISNLRFKGERVAYEMHATEFSAVYSGASTRKDIYYSDGGYEMGNCAITLHEGIQCPWGSVFMKSLGYENSWVWGGALSMDDEFPTMCVFEAPNSQVLYQHAQEKYEGLPSSSLYVRSVLTVGNYDYIQTFKADLDGSFHFFKELSGYAVGSYVLPNDASSDILADMFGAKVSKSSIGSLHTHAVNYKIDLDIAGTDNSFKTKTPGYGNLKDLLTESGIDQSAIAYQGSHSYYFDKKYLTSEGVWDNDGDMTWTPPKACLKMESGVKYIVESEEKTRVGNKRGYQVVVKASPPQILPEHDKYLHIQNFTKCELSVTKQNDADMHAAGQVIFGNLYPIPALPGTDLSHFFNDESLEKTDLVLYASALKYHYVHTEDVPVPVTMGGAISFEPYNYFMDDVSTFKHLSPEMYRYTTPSITGEPIKSCMSTTVGAKQPWMD